MNMEEKLGRVYLISAFKKAFDDRVFREYYSLGIEDIAVLNNFMKEDYKYISSKILETQEAQYYFSDNMDFKNKMEKLQEIKEYTLNLLRENHIDTVSSTHIISIVIGNNSKIIEIAENMRRKGFMLYGVKEPTVPKGTARFRIGLNPQLSKEDILRFVKELKYEIDTVF